MTDRRESVLTLKWGAIIVLIAGWAAWVTGGMLMVNRDIAVLNERVILASAQARADNAVLKEQMSSVRESVDFIRKKLERSER